MQDDQYAVTKSSGNVPIHSQELERFFGPMRGQRTDVDPNDAYPHETYNLPDAYKGKNRYLERTLNFLITSNDDWYVTDVLPWEQTDQIHVAWDVWSFDKTMADIEPHQGVPRYVTAERESHSDNLLRRGLAFIIEHGFYTTDEGREHYLLNLKQIVESVHETVFYGVIHALLSGKDYWKEWQRQYGRRARNLEDVMQYERRTWATVQKDEHGLELLDAELKERFKTQQVYPDTWIFPTKMRVYATMVPESQTEYYRKGPGAAANLEKGPQNMLTFRGSKVHETRPFDVDFTNTPIDLLHQRRQIGEYYLMQDRLPSTLKEYNSDMRSIYIYSMDSDRFEKITLVDALRNCGRFDNPEDACDGKPAHELYPASQYPPETGAPNDGAPDPQVKWVTDKWEWCTKAESLANLKGETAPTLAAYVADTTAVTSALVNNADQIKRLKADLKGTTSADSVVTKLMEHINTGRSTSQVNNIMSQLSNKVMANPSKASFKLADIEGWANITGNKRSFEHSSGKLTGSKSLIDELVEHVNDNGKLNCDFLLCRPFMTYEMASAVLLKGGKDLGATFHGHHDFQLTDDVLHKVHIGHYTFYSKSVVKNPKMYCIAEDIFSQGYLGGEGTTFLDGKAFSDDMANGGERMSGDIMCFMIPKDSKRTNNKNVNTRVCNPLSIVGNLDLSSEVDREVDQGSLPTFPCFAYYDKLLDLRSQLAPYSRSTHESFTTPYTHVNTTCFEGMQYYYNHNKQDFSNKVLNTGHWGQNVYPGVKAVRTGENKFIRKLQFSNDTPV